MLAGGASTTSLPLEQVQSCPYLKDMSVTQPDFKISNEVDLAKALYQFISKQHWLDYERTAQSSASQEGQKCPARDSYVALLHRAKQQNSDILQNVSLVD